MQYTCTCIYEFKSHFEYILYFDLINKMNNERGQVNMFDIDISLCLGEIFFTRHNQG